MEYRILALMPQKLAFGFELAGIRTRVVDHPDRLRLVLREIFQEGDVGVVLLHQHLFDALDSRMRHRVLNSVIPLFLVISPEEAGERNVEAYVEQLIKDAVGYQMRVKKTSRSGSGA